MNNLLQYISISHKTASVAKREEYHLSEEEKTALITLISNSYNGITGLFLLSTCNRTEIYFESEGVSATSILDYFINYKSNAITESEKALFKCGHSTEETINHLLQVSSGLESST